MRPRPHPGAISGRGRSGGRRSVSKGITGAGPCGDSRRLHAWPDLYRAALEFLGVLPRKTPPLLITLARCGPVHSVARRCRWMQLGARGHQHARACNTCMCANSTHSPHYARVVVTYRSAHRSPSSYFAGDPRRHARSRAFKSKVWSFWGKYPRNSIPTATVGEHRGGVRGARGLVHTSARNGAGVSGQTHDKLHIPMPSAACLQCSSPKDACRRKVVH